MRAVTPPAGELTVFCGTPHFFLTWVEKSTAYDSITAAIALHPWTLVPPEIAPKCLAIAAVPAGGTGNPFSLTYADALLAALHMMASFP